MRKTFISVLICFAALFWSFGSVYGLSAGSELVRTGSRNDRNTLTPPPNSAAVELPAFGRPRLAVTAVWRIGAFLPLTGPYAGIGLRFRHGLELALAAEKIAVSPWQLDFIDSAEVSPAAALADFKRRGAAVVLGPIQSSLARSVVQAANSLQLPLILLAPQPELAGCGRGIFQHFFNAADAAREVVRLLARQHKTRVALLRPDNSFGNLFHRVFTESCQRQQLAIWKDSSYSPTAVDFSSVITGLQQPRSGSAAGSDETGSALPNYPFSALVIADFWPRLRLIVPQLAFFGVERPQLYAISRGSELDFAREPDVNFDKIFFFDSCFHTPQPSHLLANYKKLYLSTYKQPASIYDAYAYDTIQLLAQARQSQSRGGQVNLVDSLLELPRLELLTGITTVTVEGVFAKELCPVTYNSGKLLQVK